MSTDSVFQYDASGNSTPIASETHSDNSNNSMNSVSSFIGQPNLPPPGVARLVRQRLLDVRSEDNLTSGESPPQITSPHLVTVAAADSPPIIHSSLLGSSIAIPSPPPGIESGTLSGFQISTPHASDRIPHFSEFLDSIPIPPEIAEPISKDFCLIYHPQLKKCEEMKLKLESFKAHRRNDTLPAIIRQQMESQNHLFGGSSDFKTTTVATNLSLAKKKLLEEHANNVLDLLIEEKTLDLEHNLMILNSFSVESYVDDLRTFLITTGVDERNIAVYVSKLRLFFGDKKTSHDRKVAKEIELKRKKKEKDAERIMREQFELQQKLVEEKAAEMRRIEEDKMKQIHTTVVSSFKEKGFSFSRNPLLAQVAADHASSTTSASHDSIDIQPRLETTPRISSPDAPIRSSTSLQPPPVRRDVSSLSSPPPPKIRRMNDQKSWRDSFPSSSRGHHQGPHQNFYDRRR